MEPLTPSARQYLKSLAHPLKPVVFIGKYGLSEMVITAMDQALNGHELVKVKFNDCKDQKKTIAAAIEVRTQSVLVGILGHIATFYREHPEPKQRRITLPDA